MAENEKKGKGMFRTLTKNDVELRVQQAKTYNTKNGLACYIDFLVYKNARVDRAILDETFGKFGWQNRYEVINGNLFCTIEVRDEFTGQWIGKQDVGVESNMDKEKGEASDAFKRAAFAWGVGVELYSAPHIRIFPAEGYYTIKGDKPYLNAAVELTGFEVDEDTRKITYLEISLVPPKNSTLPRYVAFTHGLNMPSDRRISDCAAWMIENNETVERALTLLKGKYVVNDVVKDKLQKVYDNLLNIKG